MEGLSPERADIIVAGVAILFEMMEFLNVNLLRINSGGIRHALIRRILARANGHTQPQKRMRTRVESAESFGRSMSIERAHADHVFLICQ